MMMMIYWLIFKGITLIHDGPASPTQLATYIKMKQRALIRGICKCYENITAAA